MTSVVTTFKTALTHPALNATTVQGSIAAPSATSLTSVTAKPAPAAPSHLHASNPIDAWRRSVINDVSWDSATVRSLAPSATAYSAGPRPSLFKLPSYPASAYPGEAHAVASSGPTTHDAGKGVDTRVSLNDFNAAYRQLNADITREMGPLRGNLARVLTTLGTWGSIGGAVAMGFAAPAALTGLLTGVGVPHGFAAAIFGLGVGLAGIAFSVLLGAIVRRLCRRSVAGSETLQSKVLVLSQIEAHLAQLKSTQGRPLDAGQAALLRNTRALLAKVDPGYGTSLRKQAIAAAAAPFALFNAAFNALRSRTAHKQGEPSGVKKKFFGTGLNADLGSTPRSSSEASLVALDGNGKRWLSALQSAPVPVIDPVGSSAQHYVPYAS